MNEEAIFHEALARSSPEERAAYLDQACAGSPALRASVEALLRANVGASGFLNQPEPAPVATVDEQPVSERAGTVIGPYKLIESIGEGGMGTVWMAQQTEPVKRLVAVKLIKAGMDSRQVIARFEAERQALALMDHPNIARVLEAGTTSAGRPYFVMDLVKGVPITRYCDEHHLTPRQRLELFLPVCQAVQHAHQKGIIHRDLKPSNVLVALYDGKPVPKVIDFGVAKAAGQALTEKTLVTGFGNIVGTLEYMSPEQAEINQLDIDTRSDIYSLGVLLYELLTGSTPFTRKQLEKAGVLEMLRMIREDEPSKPSTKLSTAEGLPTLAANRGTEPAKLTRLVRGELDWIVMKALEKDRHRRYETANGFAMDVQRYLADEPVLACPPSARYRLRKFARRNKVGLAVAALVLFFLVLLGSGIGWAVRDRSAREAEAARQQAAREAEVARQQAARQGKVAGQVESIFAEVDRLEKEQKWPEALAAARRAGAAVAGGEANAETAERVRQRLKDLELIDRLERIRLEYLRGQAEGEYAKRDQDYTRAFRDYGVDVDEPAVEASIERLKARPVLTLPIAVALDEWVSVRRMVAKGDAGWKRLVAIAHGIDPEPVRDRLRSAPQPLTPEARDELRRLAESIDVRAHHPATLYRLGTTLEQGARGSARDRALRFLRDAQAAYPGDYWLNYKLGSALQIGSYRSKQDRDEAIRFWTVAVAIRPSAAAMNVSHQLIQLLRQRGDLDEVIALYRQLIQAMPEEAGHYWSEIGDILRDQKKPAEAAEAYRQAIAAHRQTIKARPEDALGHVLGIGHILLHLQGKPDEAIAVYREAIAARPDDAGHCWQAIGDIRRDQKKPAEAADAYREATAAHRQALATRSERAVEHALALGTILRAQGKPDEAIVAYRQGMKADPKRASWFWRDIYHTLIAQGKPDEAIAVYREAIAARPEDGLRYGYFLMIGNTLLAQGKTDDAIAEYRKVIAAHLQDGEAGRKNVGDFVLPIGRTLIDHGKADEAIALHRQLIEAGPEIAGTYLSSIGNLLRQQKPAKAIEVYGKAIELKPSDPACHHGLGLALREQNKPGEANAAFDRAIELCRKAPDPKSAGAYWYLGVVLRDRGELDEAIAAFRKSLDIAPTYGIHDLVNALRARGRPAEALDVYRKAIQADPTDDNLYLDFGKLLVEQNKLDEAVTAYRKAVELAKTANLAAGVHLEIAVVLHRQKKLTEAIAAYHRGIELDPRNHGAFAYINLGSILRGWGRLDEAAACFRQAIAINNPRNNTVVAHRFLGEVLLEQNKLTEAAASFNEAIQLERNSPVSHQYLAWILASRPEANLRDPKRAVVLAKTAVELAPSSVMAWQFLGWVHYRAGDWKASIEALEKSCKLQQGGTGDSGQWIVMALAHARLAAQDGLPDKARELHRIEARRWFKKADKLIDSWCRARPSDVIGRAIWDFRAEARELMGTKDGKK